VPTVRHADYAGAWIDLMGEDSRAIVRAASAASKAADYLLAFRDRQAGAAGQENGHRTLPEADGPTCRRCFRPRSPLFWSAQSPRGRGGTRSFVTAPMRPGERLPAGPSLRTNRRTSHGQVATQDRLERTAGHSF
jgi:hypothetical protein